MAWWIIVYAPFAEDHQHEFAIRLSMHLRYQHLLQYMITDLTHQFYLLRNTSIYSSHFASCFVLLPYIYNVLLIMLCCLATLIILPIISLCWVSSRPIPDSYITVIYEKRSRTNLSVIYVGKHYIVSCKLDKLFHLVMQIPWHTLSKVII